MTRSFDSCEPSFLQAILERCCLSTRMRYPSQSTRSLISYRMETSWYRYRMWSDFILHESFVPVREPEWTRTGTTLVAPVSCKHPLKLSWRVDNPFILGQIEQSISATIRNTYGQTLVFLSRLFHVRVFKKVAWNILAGLWTAKLGIQTAGRNKSFQSLVFILKTQLHFVQWSSLPFCLPSLIVQWPARISHF